ncbi:hypothetical protein Trydic_g17183 [Trypoxylus dichotomus]
MSLCVFVVLDKQINSSSENDQVSTRGHTIAEEVILPVALDVVNIILGESAGKRIPRISLSNNTISWRIDHIGRDPNDQLIQKMKSSEFGLQLDTDSNKDAHLIFYIGFLDDNINVEELLFCRSKASLKTQSLNLNETRSLSGPYEGLQLWIRKIKEDGDQCFFSGLHKYVVHNKVAISQDLLCLFKEHPPKLVDWFA